MKIFHYTKTNIFTIKNLDLTINEIANIFIQNNIKSTIIIDKNKPIYIISHTDIIKSFINNEQNLKISEILTKYPKKLITINKNEDIYTAYQIMREKKLSHIIVTNDDDSLFGELYQEDLISSFIISALTDPITEINNKTFLEIIAEKYNNYNKNIGVISIKIDNLQTIKNIYNENIVNELLKIFALNLKKYTRDIDFLVRDEDKFIILIFNQTPEIVAKIAKRLLNQLPKTINVEIDINLDIIIGISNYIPNKNTLKDAIKCSDNALYLAKQEGENLKVFDDNN